MTKQYENNPIYDYESALADLKSNGENMEAQHKAVLALARAGSLDFAISEYTRYGLDQVRGHEDIMALDGRLSKDLFLTTSGKVALEHARDSAAKYERAFQDTKGYYCGVNSATMAHLADMPWGIVKDRVHTLLNALPPAENLTRTDHYFIEATRAECHLLLGEVETAAGLLKKAIDFDPLNYPAHATTLKQFGLILNKREAEKDWLQVFMPPRPVHYAGHIWHHKNEDIYSLKTHLSNVIQKNDVGFAYGSLAAGSDIVIAEALLAEGVELNIILPSDPKNFIQESVVPFGRDWLPRFENCLSQARTLVTLAAPDKALVSAQTMLASRMAMGRAILRSYQFDVSALQILILDPSRKLSMTLQHKVDWVETGLEGIEIPIGDGRQPCKPRLSYYADIAILMATRGSAEIQKFDSVDAAMSAIDRSKVQMVALHFDIPGATQQLEHILESDLDATILATDLMAGYMAVMHKDTYGLNYAGGVDCGDKDRVRFYTVRPRS